MKLTTLSPHVRTACRELGIEARGAVVALAAVKLWGPAGELSWWWVASPALSLLLFVPLTVLGVPWLAGLKMRRMQRDLERRAAVAKEAIAAAGGGSSCSSGCAAPCDAPKPRALPKMSEAARQRAERMARRRSTRNDLDNDNRKDSPL